MQSREPAFESFRSSWPDIFPLGCILILTSSLESMGSVMQCRIKVIESETRVYGEKKKAVFLAEWRSCTQTGRIRVVGVVGSSL